MNIIKKIFHIYIRLLVFVFLLEFYSDIPIFVYGGF